MEKYKPQRNSNVRRLYSTAYQHLLYQYNSARKIGAFSYFLILSRLSLTLSVCLSLSLFPSLFLSVSLSLSFSFVLSLPLFPSRCLLTMLLWDSETLRMVYSSNSLLALADEKPPSDCRSKLLPYDVEHEDLQVL